MRTIAPVTKKLYIYFLQVLILIANNQKFDTSIFSFSCLCLTLKWSWVFGFFNELKFGSYWEISNEQFHCYNTREFHNTSYPLVFLRFEISTFCFPYLNTLKVNFLKQVSGATRALEYTSDLPKFPDTYDMPKERALDVFDFLHYVFGFQVHTIFFSLPEPLHSQCVSVGWKYFA